MSSGKPKPHLWIPDCVWLNLIALSFIRKFSSILEKVSHNSSQWRTWYETEAPEDEPIPDGYDSWMSAFDRLLMVRCWCPHRTLHEAHKYIQDSLGSEYVERGELDLERLSQENDSQSPLVGLISPSDDPTSSIKAVAKKLKIGCQVISMGSGQEFIARRAITQSMVHGGWVVLQNGHLSTDYLKDALAQIRSTDSVHADFRLWVTSESSNQFPVNFLQASTRFAYDVPCGVKAGMKWLYVNLLKDPLDQCSTPQWPKLLYAVAFLHVTLRKRSMLGPPAWNVPLEFALSDLSSTVRCLQNYVDGLERSKGVNWSLVRYMIGEVELGAQFTDENDARLLTTLCEMWFTDDLFSETFTFAPSVAIPSSSSFDEYLDYFNSLPDCDSPETFGLTPTADTTHLHQTADRCFEMMWNVLAARSGHDTPSSGQSTSAVGDQSKVASVRQLCDDIQAVLPDNYVTADVRARLGRLGALQPMTAFLRREIERMQAVMSTVSDGVISLLRFIDGQSVYDDALMEVFDAIHDAKVPRAWIKMSWESGSLSDWLSELNDRNDQLRSWCYDSRPNSFWLGGFFYARAFLTAMKQETARKRKGWSLDTVSLGSDVIRCYKDDVRGPPLEGVYVHGLVLDNAAWDTRTSRIIDAKLQSQYETMPVIHMFAVNSSSCKDPACYQCPIYTKPNRNNSVTTVDLKTAIAPAQCVVRSVALLCATK